MDYCSSCRRHLNGALVCPGCGAYAPDIAPHTPAAVPAARAAAPSATWYDDDLPAEPMSSALDEAASDDVEDAPAAPQEGRAARRRQLARWKKNKRRAAVASAVALVGGGLTLASMDRQSPDRAQAASAPDNRPMGATDGETDTGTPPVSTPPGHHRSPRTTTPVHTQQPAAAAPHRQTVATAPRTTLRNTHPDAAAAPVPAQTPAAHQQAPAQASDSTGTVAQQPSTPAPAPSTSSGTDSGTSRTSPSPAATSPSQLCLLVVCLG
ncbi:hypothetical protein [Streptomyces sp. NPDC058755]|uniref:SCO2400 family protein n=1 Tax=Streptomyces sp. NPDC058755 TaxID=3346624 RepID=UPI00369EF7CA